MWGMGKSQIVGGIALLAVLALSGCATGSTSAQSDFLASVKPVWYGDLPSNAQLIAYGEDACAAQTGPAYTPSQVVPGATATPVSLTSSDSDKNNWNLGRFAAALCP